ncbi:MAG: N-acetylmuramoyl-L-alanine amidase [Saprospiraceae bacterium]
MKQLFLSLLLSACMAASLTAQPGSRTVVDLLPHDFLTGSTALLPIRLAEVSPFLAWSVEWEGSEALSLEIRFYEAGRWGEWSPLIPDPHSERKAPRFISQLGFAPASSTHFDIRILPREAAAELASARVHFFNPGDTPTPPTGNDAAGVLACPCPQPAYLDRLGWCPSGNCPTDPTPVPTSVTHLIVHHSAGANTSSDWPAVVRSIWDYHVNSNGWDDIGYNWLIDPKGVLYEGRGNDLLGAHFCGTNGNTMGVCMMGTYTSVPPSDTSLQTLTHLLGWKACDRDIDPEDFSFHNGSGLNLFNISGHRDGCATACPGDSLYARLPGLRMDVRDYIDSCEPSSIIEKTDFLAIFVFPNPADEVLNIRIPSEGRNQRIRIFDPQGRLAWSSPKPYSGGEQITLSIKGWAKGLYSIQYGAGRQTKVLVQ